jgi:hypothetical protein
MMMHGITKPILIQVFVGETWKAILIGRPRHRGDLILD